MNIRTHLRFGLCSLLLIGTLAQADDLVPPPWTRGGPNMTSQEWTFDSPTDIFGHPVNTPAGSFFNPYGQPFVVNPGDGIWLPNDSSFNPTPTGRSGIVAIGPGLTLRFRIPNQENLSNQKEIWVQLTWWAAPGTNVVVSPLVTAPNSGTIVGTQPLGGGWNHTTASYVLAQQPAFEEFWVQNLTSSRLYIDQLVVDTRCVPEPAALAALALGIAGFAAKRKRR